MASSDIRPFLSIALITKNEDKRLGRCLNSLPFAAHSTLSREIIVVDAESHDNTVAVAREFGARTFVRRWEGYGEQRNFALEQCRGDWILMLDADEVLTPELIAEIERELPTLPDTVNGCFIRWHDFYLGKWMKHGGWSPYQLRLVRNGAVHCTLASIHEGLRVTGERITLRHAVNHYSYESLHDCLAKADLYSSLAIPALSDGEKKRWKYRLVTAPLVSFFGMYFRRKGCLDGWHGFVASVMTGYHDFLLYAKLWEKQLPAPVTATGSADARNGEQLVDVRIK